MTRKPFWFTQTFFMTCKPFFCSANILCVIFMLSYVVIICYIIISNV
jgi:hypothetical protein